MSERCADPVYGDVFLPARMSRSVVLPHPEGPSRHCALCRSLSIQGSVVSAANPSTLPTLAPLTSTLPSAPQWSPVSVLVTYKTFCCAHMQAREPDPRGSAAHKRVPK